MVPVDKQCAHFESTLKHFNHSTLSLQGVAALITAARHWCDRVPRMDFNRILDTAAENYEKDREVGRDAKSTAVQHVAAPKVDPYMDKLADFARKEAERVHSSETSSPCSPPPAGLEIGQEVWVTANRSKKQSALTTYWPYVPAKARVARVLIDREAGQDLLVGLTDSLLVSSDLAVMWRDGHQYVEAEDVYATRGAAYVKYLRYLLDHGSGLRRQIDENTTSISHCERGLREACCRRSTS